jgi:hypothetical protein
MTVWQNISVKPKEENSQREILGGEETQELHLDFNANQVEEKIPKKERELPAIHVNRSVKFHLNRPLINLCIVAIVSEKIQAPHPVAEI